MSEQQSGVPTATHTVVDAPASASKADAVEPSSEAPPSPGAARVSEAEPAAAEIAPANAGAAAVADANARAAKAQPSYLAQAAALVGAVGLGWAAGSGILMGGKPQASPVEQAFLAIDWQKLAASAQKSEANAARLATDLQLLKTSVSGLKETVDRSRQDVAARLGGMTERLDKAQRTEQEISGKVTSIGERLDRADRVIPAVEAKLGPIAERLDRIERQGLAIANTVAGGHAAPAAKQAAVAEPAQTAAIPDKPKIVEGWILRDVYKGTALVEGRNQRLVEISPGQSLPGVGRIEAIERRGKTWVVVTAKGIITSQQW